MYARVQHAKQHVLQLCFATPSVAQELQSVLSTLHNQLQIAESAGIGSELRGRLETTQRMPVDLSDRLYGQKQLLGVRCNRSNGL